MYMDIWDEVNWISINIQKINGPFSTRGYFSFFFRTSALTVAGCKKNRLILQSGETGRYKCNIPIMRWSYTYDLTLSEGKHLDEPFLSIITAFAISSSSVALSTI